MTMVQELVVKSFFGNIQRLYNFFSSSPSRWKNLQEATGVSLHKLSTTRCSARIEAVKPLVKRPRLKDRDFPGDLSAKRTIEICCKNL